MVIEIWKDVVGYIGLYMVSNLGRVKSFNYKHTGKEQILKSSNDSHGYLKVSLYKNNKREYFKVHKLVLEAFGSLYSSGLECRHLNGVRSDNRLCNLKLGTGKENCRDAINHGTFQMGSKHYLSKLDDDQIRVIRNLCKEGELTLEKIGKRFGVSITTISDIKNKKIYKSVL